jgi:hypothetical protein
MKYKVNYSQLFIPITYFEEKKNTCKRVTSDYTKIEAGKDVCTETCQKTAE